MEAQADSISNHAIASKAVLPRSCTLCQSPVRRKIVTTVAVAIVPCVAQAQNPAPTKMTKIGVRLQSPDVPERSFPLHPKPYIALATTATASKKLLTPKTEYTASLSPTEPDAWMVKLLSNSARHVVDPGAYLLRSLAHLSGR
jgi:hypothetical protein